MEEVVKMGKRIKNKTTILKPTGKLLGGMEADVLRKNIQQLILRGVRHLILDLSHIQMINGPGIEFLIDTLLQFKKMSGSLKLINPSKRIRKVFDMTNLSTVFNVTDSMSTTNAPDTTEAVPVLPFHFKIPECKPKFLACH